MNTITHTALGVTNTYEIVDYIPCGYKIWNIGRNAPEGYLPLCRMAQYQPFPGGRQIDIETLKAIKIEGAEAILDAVGFGPATLSEMVRYVKRHRNSTDSWKHYCVELYRKAIPIMRKIKGIENLSN